MIRLRPNLHWCECEGRAVFLDVEADRYFCLPEAANAAFLRVASGAGLAGDEDQLAMLFSRGLIQKGRPVEANSQSAPIAQAQRDINHRPGPFQPIRVLQMAAFETRAAWLLRTSSLRGIVDRVRDGKGALVPVHENANQRAAEVARAAASVALWSRSHDRCLVRALAVHALCRRLGCPTVLVFGVTAHPFAAHCWVQFGGEVVVGDFEQTRLYTPILVLE